VDIATVSRFVSLGRLDHFEITVGRYQDRDMLKHGAAQSLLVAWLRWEFNYVRWGMSDEKSANKEQEEQRQKANEKWRYLAYQFLYKQIEFV